MAISDKNIQSFSSLLANEAPLLSKQVHKTGFLCTSNNQLLKVEAKLNSINNETLVFSSKVAKNTLDFCAISDDYLCEKTETKNYNPDTGMYVVYLPEKQAQQKERLQVVTSNIKNLDKASAKILAEHILVNVAEQLQVSLS